MKRVLLVGKGPPDTGGIAAFLQELLGGDLARRHRLELLNVAHGGRREGGRVSAGNLGRTAADAAAVRRAARNCDVVHLHTAAAPLVTLVRAGALAAAGRAGGARVIVHAHGGRVQLWATTPGRRRLAGLALAGADHVVAVSEEGRRCLAGAVGQHRVSLVDNGVDLDRFAPAPALIPALPRRRVPRVLFVGGLTPRKGVLDLLAASAALLDRGRAHEVVLVGGMPDEGPAAEAEVRAALAAAPGARPLGTVAHDGMPAVYRGADVLCLPSWWEAMPLSVLEAMASGLPVVAAAVGDVGRLVDDGVTGVLVPPRSPGALAEALDRVLAAPDRGAAMGVAGRRRAEARFSIERTVDALDALYEAQAPSRRIVRRA